MKLTSDLLKKIVEEEVKKFGPIEDVEKRAKETKEIDADGFADTLEKKIDYVKALKIEESRLRKRLAKIVEAKTRALKTITSLV